MEISTTSKTRDEEQKSLLSMDWHLFPLEDLTKRLGCYDIKGYVDLQNAKNSFGLPNDEAERRLERDGKNMLTGQKEPSPVIQYLKKFLDPLIMVLNICGVVSFVIYGLDPTQYVNLYLAVGVVIVVLVSVTLGYIQEGRSRAVMAHFMKLMSAKCTVIREGREIIIETANLVRGDVVFLRVGDAVPADVRLLFVNEIKLENSVLTGESVPVACQDTCPDDKTPLFEASNVAWSSTNVVEGEALGIVFACGNDSRIGSISALTDKTGRVESTLQKEIKRFVYIVASFALAQSILFT
ncbi:P-type ATPase [Reticulomyxa filosa]|uniref:P-type ATPase n=1 Tax=Reticulomyxa filosa TaxID=46433 RepID=X6MYN4_RETFI|nr:P-type ATPase [Reticulomyxa filosa]|eukprot:ETO18599.1 P-type ATPase [Reticulomyxa filosa]